jgi:uncharacterized protein involved in response to NO
MQFSEDSQHSYFFSQPHQPFFVLAFINAIVTMLIFMLAYKGVIHMAISPSDFHAYGFTYLLFTPAFFGFLFTTFPRFASTDTIEKSVYMRIFGFYYIGSTLFLLGSIVSPLLSAIGMLTLVVGHALGYLILKNIYTSTTMEDKHDLYWITLTMGLGLMAHFIFIIGQLFLPSLVGFSTEISTYLYLFLLAFSVGQRMVPFFSHCMVEKNMALLKQIFILLILHIVLEGIATNSSFIVDFFIAYLTGKELFRWKLPFPNPNPLLWILHIALYWVPIAFMFSGLSNLISLLSDVYFLALDIHVIVLGFVFTILLGFGTRVTLGHSGNKMFADKWTTMLFVWTQVVVLLRILTSFAAAFGLNFMILFDITATAWFIMFIAWSVRFLLVLVKGKKLTD